MRTPAGKECRYYYADFHRGRNIQECRLVKDNPESERWHPNDCSRCPVPDILLANADPDLELKLTIKRGFLGLTRKLDVEARDAKTGEIIEDPYIGNIDTENNPGLEIFRKALEEDDD
ncbi:hypothetical protein G4Y79_15505 [Phototrophicus methaneseepsis]|uniref:Uncharacterized protein n=1 Tax=Phototrophicus methaneseepsis TaxID=2710758 RepID=A0A7S8E663_9CHLR|nr:hypothetical protein [Phototrophicus methaneseepsis]QPC81108.1 hypothetical protein G4Y79_15505 [Phototrophicus methaneseepsis]